jgi:internalin A
LRGLVLDSTVVSDDALEGLTDELPDLAVYKSQRRACVELSKIGVALDDRDIDHNQRANPHQAAAPPAWLRSEAGDVYFAESPTVVRLSESRTTGADLRWLTNLVDVRAVHAHREQPASSSLARLYLGGTTVTDSTLACVSRCPTLTWLDFSNTSITDEGLAHVAALRRLEGLDLSGTRITDAGLTLIAGLTHLEYLWALDTSIGDKGLSVVAELALLRRLDVSGTLVTNDGLFHLQRSKTLRVLDLSGTRITDKGTCDLQKLTQLTHLAIYRTHISPERRDCRAG